MTMDAPHLAESCCVAETVRSSLRSTSCTANVTGRLRSSRTPPANGTKVIDRGPYTPGNDFDLTNGARLALGFEGVGQVRYALALESAARHD